MISGKSKRNGQHYLISIANHQAQLNNNAAAASAALEAADQRLSEANDPSLFTVRKSITDNIIALRRVAKLDVTSIALTLSRLEQEVSTLVLARSGSEEKSTEERATADSSLVDDLDGFASKVWSDVKGLVVVRRGTGGHKPLLPPGQIFFLQQNLRLKLEAARIALLQRDSQLFQESLSMARQWINTYFDTEATSAANLLSSMAPYEGLELNPTLPDILNSLQQLDAWSSKQSSSSSQATTTEATLS